MWWPYSWAIDVRLHEVAARAVELPLEDLLEERGVEVDGAGRSGSRTAPLARSPGRSRC